MMGTSASVLEIDLRADAAVTRCSRYWIFILSLNTRPTVCTVF